MTEAGRDLQETHKQEVLGKFNANGNPLYLKLAFEEARRWKSWEGLPCGSNDIPGLNEDVAGIPEDLFWRLEQDQHHGQMLVSRALRYVGAGKNGLTEDELLDILSADQDVMKDFYRQSPTELGKAPEDRIKRLPVVLWSRLFFDIQPYMTRRRADGTVVLDFYNRQVGESVAKRYVQRDDLLSAHLHLADYFRGLDYWAESLEAQRARARRLPPTPRPANVRKVVELPYHRIEAAKLGGEDEPKSPLWDAVGNLLTGWQFLEAKAEAGTVFDLAADFQAAVRGMPLDCPRRPTLHLLGRSLSQQAHFIAKHPTALFQSVWNSCNWLAPHPLKTWCTGKHRLTPDFPWIRLLSPSHDAMGPLIWSLPHPRPVTSVAFDPHTDMLVTGCEDGCLRM